VTDHERVPDGFARVRILPGPQDDYFAADALRVLQASPYTIGQSSDRMGFRLEGARLSHSRGADIISDATPIGAIQVPASGLPILLMADRQTTGGYPKIATVITADLGLAGQLGPGDTISFAVCSPARRWPRSSPRNALMAIERPEVA
jgi:allophanate hydrolase